MSADEAQRGSFVEFVGTAGPRLRVSRMENPSGYLYAVGRDRGRRAIRRAKTVVLIGTPTGGRDAAGRGCEALGGNPTGQYLMTFPGPNAIKIAAIEDECSPREKVLDCAQLARLPG